MNEAQAAMFHHPVTRNFFRSTILRDTPAAMKCLANDVTVQASFFPETVVGIENIPQSFEAFVNVCDRIEIERVFHDGPYTGVKMKIFFGEFVLDGLDYTHQNEEGLIDQLLVMWRPLESILAFRNAMFTKMGVPHQKLVSEDAA
ncbi:hypothetical protein AWL63_04230 [Sphingomonas panacis]|uniref:SnoaL-like domain-containing protein n=1 Tax=Sphingomonas panacis TaxID=1560345 RepID=A0A1B3Z791_9SPHN|nr:hypothetical protein [Sphingomonas panacis]AOH83295.1 hypothetical protein AWL63_04230 [Sphingomonas panacis]